MLVGAQGQPGGPRSQTASCVSRKPQEERGERRETAKARGKQLEDLLCTGSGPQHPPKEASTLAGGHPRPTAAFRSEAAVGVGWEGRHSGVPMTILLLLAGGRPDTVTLRSAKSEESLSSQASGAGERWVAHPQALVELGGLGALRWPLNVLQIWGIWGGFLFCFLVPNVGMRCRVLDKASPLVHDVL